MARRTRAEFLAPYKIVREIGKGGFSVVYEAVDKASGEHVAVKRIAKKDSDSAEQIVREFSIQRKFESPYIVNIIDFADCGGEFLFALEYANRGELFSAIANGGPFGEADAANMTKQILLGLKVLHSNGIIHRDLKPENLLLHVGSDGQQVVKISDFGLAGIYRGEKLTEYCGTVNYCAREIFQNHPYNESADLWSLGVVVYVLLVGFLPFSADDLNDLYEQVVNVQLSFDDPEWRAVSHIAKDFIRGLIKANPEERMTVDQALGHMWLRDAPTPPLGDIRKHLKAYHVRQKMKRMIAQAEVAVSLSALDVKG